MARAPRIPGSPRDPTGADRLERGAIRDMRRRFRLIGRRVGELVLALPSQPVVNQRYTYQLDPVLLQQLLADLNSVVETVLLEGGEADLWLLRQYVEVGAARGAAQAYASLSIQFPAYAAGRPSAIDVLRTDAYRRRAALTGARVFEEMRGLSGETKADLARVLTDGIARGLNPRTVAETINARTGVGTVRGARIARTEITTALRRAKWDEADEAAEQFGSRTLEMHLSALSPTTRPDHAARHALLYTRDQCRDWWSEGANSINCKCNTTSVAVDADGKPLVPIAQQRARAAKARFLDK